MAHTTGTGVPVSNSPLRASAPSCVQLPRVKGTKSLPSGSPCACSQGQQGTDTLCFSVSRVLLPLCHLQSLGLNPQPQAKDLEHGEYPEPLVPGAQPPGVFASLSTQPWAVTAPLCTVLLTHGKSSAPPGPGFSVLVPLWPLVPGSSPALLTLHIQPEPRSRASHPGGNRSHGASETMGKTITSHPVGPKELLMKPFCVFVSLHSSPPPQMWLLRSVLMRAR